MILKDFVVLPERALRALDSLKEELASSLGAHARTCSDVILLFSKELID